MVIDGNSKKDEVCPKMKKLEPYCKPSFDPGDRSQLNSLVANLEGFKVLSQVDQSLLEGLFSNYLDPPEAMN